MVTLKELQKSVDGMQRFWEIEDLQNDQGLTADEIKCDKIYEETYAKNQQGVFVVRIPFKEGEWSPTNLGESKRSALARFYNLETKLTKNKELRDEYVKAMNEYIALGHMIEVDKTTEKAYYIPHHAVIKPDSLTTKTRVVFDASAKTSSGIALNECMLIGSKQQEDLFVILARWRTKKIVFKADIEKMYRQIELHEDDRKYHTILWRNEATEPVKEYQITFGTAAAPYLATKTLRQLAELGEQKYPIVSEILKNDFYVDDLISGADSINNAIAAKNELMEILKEGGMRLRKWTSNNQQLLYTLPVGETEKSLQLFSDNEDSKTLGLKWNPKTDMFHFDVSWYNEDGTLTKRKLLSEASKLFDPAGWLAPIVIKAKILMTEVWRTKIDWDEAVPEVVIQNWKEYHNDLVRLNEIKIPRWIQIEPGDDVSIHGFCDGSDNAYSAVVYVRVAKKDKVIVTLVAAKTRVAPKKSTTHQDKNNFKINENKNLCMVRFNGDTWLDKGRPWSVETICKQRSD